MNSYFNRIILLLAVRGHTNIHKFFVSTPFEVSLLEDNYCYVQKIQNQILISCN